MSAVGDTVMVLMHSPERKVIAWDGKEFVLEAGKEKFIPFELAANYFGDPRAIGAIVSTQDHRRRVGWIPDRATEVRRLRVLYGVQHGDEAQVFLPDGLLETMRDPEKKDFWRRIDANIPKVEVYDIDTKERLYTVLEDPMGEHVTPASITITNEQRLQTKVDRLTELVENLIGRSAPGEGLVTPEGIIAGNPDAPRREPSAAEQAMAEFRKQDGEESEQPAHDLITSDRSGAAGLPADQG